MRIVPGAGKIAALVLVLLVSATAILLLIVSATGFPQRDAARPTPTAGTPADTASHIVTAAQAVLASLDEAGRARMLFPFDGPQKTRWSNFPTGIFQRQGLRMGDLTPPQRAAVTTLMTTALSTDGYRKVTEIIRGDEVLKATEGAGAPRGGGGPRGGAPPGGGPPGARGGAGPDGPGGGLMFGEDEYYLALVGAPSTTAPWMLQFGGHHLAINLTMAGSHASMTPSLPAAQPAAYTFEGREIRPLGQERDKAFALISALALHMEVMLRGQIEQDEGK